MYPRRLMRSWLSIMPVRTASFTRNFCRTIELCATYPPLFRSNASGCSVPRLINREGCSIIKSNLDKVNSGSVARSLFVLITKHRSLPSVHSRPAVTTRTFRWSFTSEIFALSHFLTSLYILKSFKFRESLRIGNDCYPTVANVSRLEQKISRASTRELLAPYLRCG